jgi:putative transcriptional regulator
MSEIVCKLAALRKERGLTQPALAKRAGCTQATVSNLETGKSRRIEFDLLGKLAEALHCEPGELLVKKPTPPKPPESLRIICDGRTYEVDYSGQCATIFDVASGEYLTHKWDWGPVCDLWLVGSAYDHPETNAEKYRWCDAIEFIRSRPGFRSGGGEQMVGGRPECWADDDE